MTVWNLTSSGDICPFFLQTFKTHSVTCTQRLLPCAAASSRAGQAQDGNLTHHARVRTHSAVTRSSSRTRHSRRSRLLQVGFRGAQEDGSREGGTWVGTGKGMFMRLRAHRRTRSGRAKPVRHVGPLLHVLHHARGSDGQRLQATLRRLTPEQQRCNAVRNGLTMHAA